MYSSKLVRVACGDHDTNIIDYIDGVISSGGTLRDVIVVLDLAQKNPDLVGFSGIFHGLYSFDMFIKSCVCLYFESLTYMLSLNS